MPAAHPPELLAPRYGDRSLSELLPAVVGAVLAGSGRSAPAPAASGAPVPGGALALAPTSRACLLLVDGLGWSLLRRHPDAAPFLTSLLASEPARAGPITVGFPATTATSMGSLGTGSAPGVHGLVGFEVALPGQDRVMNLLRWDDGVDPRAWQPGPTWFERAAAAGVAVTRVGPAGFDGSGLTEAALRGGAFAAADTVGERVAVTLEALRRDAAALVYCYYGDLDTTGHRRGVASPAWRLQLAHVDRMAEQLADGLPPGTALWVTADHGMVDVAPTNRVDVAREPQLAAGVRALAGEPRARHVHTVPGAAGDVLGAWQERLGTRMTVLSRADAVAAGWFGPTVSERVLPRIGDVVAAAREHVAVLDSRRMPPDQLALVGLHGSLTPEELLVPLLELRSG